MNSEPKMAIAFTFKCSGKDEMTVSEFILLLSMELHWFSPQEAKGFLNNAIKGGLLVENDELIKPTFDIKKTVIPVGFHPTKKVFNLEKPLKKERRDLKPIGEIIEKIAEKTEISKRAILKKIELISNEKNITRDVAALYAGKKYDIRLDEFFSIVEDGLLANQIK